MDARRTPRSPGLPADKASTRAGTSATETVTTESPCAGPSALSDTADSEPAQQAAVPVEDSGSRSARPLQLERVPAGSRRYPLALLRWLAKLLVRGEELLTKLLTNCLDEFEPWLKWKVYDRRLAVTLTLTVLLSLTLALALALTLAPTLVLILQSVEP